ncbi:ABC transporter permease [Desulfoscipio geothermicus]|uniref:ABC-2 type transport system permease protein n=1 Tax=Desulfoscipio geothermicus DSM 3669 TaxID=1121426 RepID=A0A1I6CXJ4_9FIRM|nr:ABC transporter permease [Desulfoscipio geothermicus]SFQ97890.1 ABC-2 type transport system permease protein [Desulfoscipio geothermicus DSM 3669]
MWQVFLNEIACIFRDRRTLALLFGLPLVVTLFFGYLYINHKVTEIPTVVLDRDNSPLSRETVTAFDQSEKFAVTGHVFTRAEVDEYFRRGRAAAAIVIPPDFARDIKTGQGTEVLIVSDGSNMIISNTIATGAAEVIGTISAGIELKSLEGLGISGDRAEDIVSAVSFRSRVWYNPTYNYLKFLLPGLIVMGMQQALLIAAAIALYRRRRMAEGNAGTVIAAKILPYFLIGTPVLLSCLTVAHLLFQVPLGGDRPLLLLLTAAFCLGTVELGVLAALLSSSLDKAIQVAMVVAAPAFLISGFTWPMLVIPPPVRALAYMLPLTHYLDALRAVAMKGAGFGDVTTQLLYMVTIACALVPVCAAVLYFKRRRRQGFEDGCGQLLPAGEMPEHR